MKEICRRPQDMTKSEKSDIVEDDLISVFTDANNVENDGNDEVDDPMVLAVACYQNGYYPDMGIKRAREYIEQVRMSGLYDMRFSLSVCVTFSGRR